MAEGDFQEKTEKPTPRRRSEARKKGDVAKSREVASVAVLLSGLSALYVFGSVMYSHMGAMMQQCFSMVSSPSMELADFLVFHRDVVGRLMIIVLPVMLTVVAIAVLSNLMQVGVVFSLEKLKPKFSNFNIIKGIKRLFSKQSLVELFKNLAKIAIVGIIAYWTVEGEMGRLRSLGGMEVWAIALYIFKVIFKIFIWVSLAMMLLAVLDYAFQKWQFEEKLKMTKQEVKEEFKRTEGDPLVKSRIRRVQQEVARRRMMQEVPKADVVVTNPVRLALALRYDSAVMSAPQVVAKGAGNIAERIKALAREHNIPIVEDKELAQNLYKMVEINDHVPDVLYHAVADVLAYVYKLKGKAA